jgi:outer membrane protein assembly factor BamB
MVFGRDLAYSAVGYPEKNFLCIRADGDGDVTRTHVVWSKRNNMAYVPTPLLADGILYMVEDRGRVVSFDALSGDVIWEARLEGGFSSSPVLAGGHIYAVNEAGATHIFKPGRKFELAAKNDLADGGFATPVICGGRIYLRTLHRLYCLGRSQPAAQRITTSPD